MLMFCKNESVRSCFSQSLRLCNIKQAWAQTKLKIYCLAQRQQLRINVLLAILNSSAPMWLSSSCQYHISKQSFFWLLFSASHTLSSGLKCYSDESETSQFMIGASCCVDGPSGSSQCVQGDTVCHRETVWIDNDTCQEGLSVLQSEVM